MRFSHTLSTCKHYVSVSIIVLAMTLFLAGCPSPNDPAPNDSKPLLTITATQASVTEGATSTFTITRNNNEGELKVSLTLSGSAEHNADYTVDSTVNTDSTTGEKTMTVDFEDSKESVTITITAENDQDTEANGETVEIEINESDDYTIAAPSTATLTIVDPLPVVSISTSGENKAVNEGGSISVTISSNQTVTDNLEVSLTIGGTATIDEDYELSDVTTNTSGDTVTIPEGKNEVIFTVTAVNDEVPDTGEEVVITIKESGDYTIGDPSTATLTIVDPVPSDAPVVSISTSDENNAVNEGGTITVTISSSKEVPNGLEVSLTIGGDATIDEDYALPGVTTNTLDDTVTATVTINNGEKSATITIPVHDDNDYEKNETVEMSIDPSSNYHIKEGEGTVTVTITDNDLPTVGFRTTSQTLQEGDDEGVTVIVERSTDEVRDPLTVQLTIEGDATIDEDYELSGATTNTLDDTVTATVIIPSGNTVAMVTIDVINDSIHEPSENLTITIIDEPSDAYTVGDSRTATVTITDDDPPTVSIAVDSGSISESSADGEVEVTEVTLTRSQDEVRDPLIVKLSFAGSTANEGDDYTGLTTTASFGEGSDEVTITLTAVNDDIHEGAKTVVITIIDELSTYRIKEGEETVTVTITDDDLPIVGFKTTSERLDEGDGESVTVILERSNDEVRDSLTVKLSFEGTAESGDYTGLTTTARFGEGSDEVTITLIAVNDVIREAAETVAITIIDELSTYRIKEGEETVTVTITDDDLPTVGFKTTSQRLDEGDGESVTVTVERSNDEVRDSLTVKLSFEGTAESNDYTGLTTTARFREGSDEVTITLTAVNDDIPEGEETVVITIIDEPSGAYIVGDFRTATVTITDDDLPIVGFRTASQTLDEGDGESVTVTVERSNDEVGDSLTVKLSFEGTAESNDYTGLTTTAHFGEGSDEVTITLTAVNDDIPEGEETVVITIIEMHGAYTVGDSRTATVTITDDDLPIVGFRTASQTLDEGDGESVTVTVGRSNDEALLPLEVQLSFAGNATEGDDYEVITRSVTIGSGEDATDFTLQLRDDDDVEANEEVIITISEMTNAYTIDESNNEVIITIVDDDDTDGDMISNSEDVDDDNNGLIEIRNLDMLRNVHYNLAGTSYNDGSGDPGKTNGGPTELTAHCSTLVNKVYLCGYELTGDLDFNNAKSYDAESIHPAWRPNSGSHQTATNEGFPGIGAKKGSEGFTGIFEGNGHSISNLYMRNTTTQDHRTGLFRRTEAGAKIRNLGMMSVAIYGGAEDYDRVGGLVGHNRGAITASYASGTVDGGAGGDRVGGLVGVNSGDITASYASGTVDGGAGNIDLVGGLVGDNGGTITASYASGTVDGGAGDNDYVGGLVGYHLNGDITASYASGDVDGGAGTGDRVGGLVGDIGGTITASYGFGIPSGESVNSDGADKPTGVIMASDLTSTNAETSWNNAGSHTLGAWYFGTSDQNPALKYADYDGPGNTYSCDLFPATIPGTDNPLVCGTTLLPGQRD